MKSNLRRILLLGCVSLLLGVVLLFRSQSSNPPRSEAGTTSGPQEFATSEASPPTGPAIVEEPAAEAVIPPAQEVGLKEIKVQPDLAKLEAFDGWIATWQAASPEARAGMTAEGARLAALRRPEFKVLIVSNPKLALERAVPRVIRQDLPEEIVAQLEKPVSAKGDYNVIYGLPVPGVPVPIEDLTLRTFEVDGVVYEARVFGQMNSATHRKGTPLRGVAVDNQFAVSENAVRRLEIGERIAPGTTVENTCPVSSRTTTVVSTGEAVTEDSPTVEIAERVITLCEPEHVEVLEGDYRSYMQAFGTGGAGGAGFFTTNYPNQSRSIGDLKVLYVRAVYADQQVAPQSEALAYDFMSRNAEFLSRQSYGKLTQTTTFTPLITLPGTLASYNANYTIQPRLQAIREDIKRAVLSMGYDHRLFDMISIRVNGGLDGTSWGGGGGIWMGNDSFGTLNHEVGHSLGLSHAYAWDTRYLTRDGSGYGTGRRVEYGNVFDVMGSLNLANNYNSLSKRSLNWIPADFVHSATTKGIYRIFDYNQSTLEAGKRYALSVGKDNVRGYHLEYIAGRKDGYANSAIVLGTGMGGTGGNLLDTTPGSRNDVNADRVDGGIAVGQTFSDLEADIHFTVMSRNDTVPPSLDVYYEQGPFPGNVAPVIVNGVAASVVNPNVGGSVDFAVVANDANQDVLAYHWQFSDGVSGLTNAPQVTRTFNTANQITAMVTVSDRKGGTARSSVVINVGAHGRRTVSGFVRSLGVGIKGVYISNGDIGCYSDSDGAYRLAGLPTAALDLLPILHGYQPTSVNVAANVNLMDIELSARPYVTLTKINDTGEGLANGRFRLTRTGPTAAPLQVRVSSVGGAATKGGDTSDYALAPDYQSAIHEWGPVNYFTILAGQATLEVDVIPAADVSAEGPEAITLSLFPAPGPVYPDGASDPEKLAIDNASKAAEYYYNSANYIVMNLSDDDTVLPQISVTATDPYAAETGLDPGSFIFSRTGPTDAAPALNVDVTWTGSATNGNDYALLPNQVVIPAGQASVNVVLAPVDDDAGEGLETAVATLVARPLSYVLGSASSSSAEVTISDSDSVVLSISAPDAVATEGADDKGFFMISRTGSTVAPLKVYYGLSGTAQHGTDYGTLSGEVTIPAGATSVPVIIVPLEDDFAEAPETVVIALNTFNTGVDIGPSQQASLTLKDNNDLPQISLQSGVIGTEGGLNPSFFVRSFGNGVGTVSVNYILSGTSTSGVDYNAMAGTINIPANGFSTTEVTIPLINDVLAESTESIVVTLIPSVAYRLYNDREVQLAVRDNDSGGERVTVSSRRDTPSEAGATPGTFYFSRTGTVGALDVTYDVSGTATAGTDFVDLPGGGVVPANRRTVTIPAGSSGVSVVMTPIDDNAAEGAETVTLSVVGGATYSADLPASATYTILDNEVPARSVGFQTGFTSTSELPSGNGQFRDINVVLSSASADVITVGYRAAGGTAMGDNVDWAFVDAANGNARLPFGGTLTFPIGTVAQTIRVQVNDDGLKEAAEFVVLDLHGAKGASLAAGRSSHSLVIYDGAVEPSLVTEERWNTTNVYTNNTWNTVAPDVAGRLPGFTSAVDVGTGYSRRMTGQIVAPTTGRYTFWIASDDSSRLFLSTTALAADKRNEPSASVNGWTNFQEWNRFPSQVSDGIDLEAGQSYYMEVQHREDGGGDHVSVAWQGPGFERAPIVLTTPDATPYTLSLLTSSSTRLETDGSEPLLMAVLNRPAGAAPITVNYTATGTATAGSDYLVGLGSVTFAAGEQMKLLPLTILADAIDEVPEAIVVNLSNPVGAALASPTTHVITVQDAGVPTVGTLYATASSASAVGTVITTAAATPAAGRNITGWAIVAGNTGNAFSINAAGQVTLATPASLPNPGGMQLVVRAADNMGVTGDGVINVVCNTPATKVIEQRWIGRTDFDAEFKWVGAANHDGTLATFTTPVNVGNNYSRRLIGYLKPAVSGDYTFWLAGDDECRLYLSRNSSPFNKSQIVSAWWPDGFKNSSRIPLVAGQLYWLEAQQREDGGGDSLSVEWQIADGARTPIPAAEIFPYVPGIDYEGPPPTLPTLALTSPATAYDTGDNIALSANVAGGTLAVTAVEFYRGSTLIGSDAVAPYGVTWTNAIAGNHVLTARAVYSGGGVTSSATSINVADLDPAGDRDGDGFTNGLEFNLGTDPKSSASQPPVIYANLRGWWKLNETSGTVADDSTGRLQDGAVNGGAAWIQGTSQGGLEFDGVNDHVETPGSLLNARSSFTLSGCYKSALTTGNRVGLWGQNDVAEFGINGPNLQVWTAGGGSATAPIPAVNQWHHVVCVGDGTSIKIYIDGRLASTGGMATANYGTSTSPFRIGGGGILDASGNFFTGQIDDVRIYERALSAAEIGELAVGLVPNRVPSFTAGSLVASATEDVPFIGQLAATDLDFGDTQGFLKVNGPSWLNVSATGVLSGTPSNSDVGSNNFTVRVTDAGGLSSEATLAVTVVNVNDAPVAANDGSAVSPFLTMAEDTTTPAITVLANDSDVDGNPLTITAASSPDGSLVINAGTTLSFSPTANFNGNTTIAYSISDGQGGTASATVFVSVTAVNDAPTITDVVNQSTNEDLATSAIPFTIGDDDTALASLTITRTSSNTSLVPPANVVLGGSGANRTVSITPAANQSGTSTITLTVSDGTTTSTDTFVLTVNPVNDLPTITDVADQSLNEDTATSAIAFTIGDIETAATTLAVTRTSSNTSLVPLANVVLGGSGANRTVTITPAANQFGTSIITLTVSDGTTTATDTFVLTVTPVNDLPLAVNDGSIDSPFVTALEDSVSSPIAVLGNDTDVDLNPLTVTAASSSNGAVVINSGTTLTFTPDANFNGATTISYTISDGQGGTANATVFVSVTPVNDAPLKDDGALADFQIAKRDAISGEGYTGSFADVASDPDGDGLTFTKTSGPGWLIVDASGALSGTPSVSDEVADTSVVIRATDSGGLWMEASFQLTVIVRRSLAVNYSDSATTSTAVLATENTNALNAAISISGPVVWNNQAINDAGNGVLSNGRGSGTYSGITVDSFSSVPYQRGSSALSGGDASQRVFRYYLDDGGSGGSYATGDSVGASIHITGLQQFLAANRAQSYILTLLYNADSTSATPFHTATIRSGVPAAPSATAISNLPLLGTITPSLLGDGKQPLPTVGTDTGGRRGWGRYSDLTANSITISLPVSSSGRRGSIAGFILTPVPVNGAQPMPLVQPSPQNGYALWLGDHFGETASDPAISGETADPNHDGVPNLVAYAMGIDPLAAPAPGATAAQLGRIEVVKGNGIFHFDYQLDTRVTDVVLVIEDSSTLGATSNWAPANVVNEILSDSGGIRTLRATYTPLPGDTRRFFRLRASR